MAAFNRIMPDERGRFLLLAVLFFLNSMVLESNEVVATSGFISNIGAPQIVVVWAIDMSIVIVTSGIYSLFVDRTRRGRLAVIMYFLFAAVYLALFGLFTTEQGAFGYGLLLVINDQQWLLFPLLIWALANDMFSVASAKRLFPLLGIAIFTGGIVGNGIAAGMAQIAGTSYRLLLFNMAVILGAGILLMLSLNRIQVTNRQARVDEKLLDSLREGIAFIREVPIFRYLTLAMVLLGIGLNAIEFDFLFNVSNHFTTGSDIQTFYGTFKIAVAIGLLLVQGFVAVWLLNNLGFKHIFLSLPTAMLSGLTLAFMFPSIIGVIIGNYLVRVTKIGIDEPSIKAFQGLVPDERRGRVSAFMDGYLYPLGSILSCIVIGSTMIAVGNGMISMDGARNVYLGIAILAACIALISASRIASSYDKSMLNWRLKRRKRDSASALGEQASGTVRRRGSSLLDTLIDDSVKQTAPGKALEQSISEDAEPGSAVVSKSLTPPLQNDDAIDSLLVGIPRRHKPDPLGALLESDASKDDSTSDLPPKD